MKQKLFTLLLAVAASIGTLFAWDYEHVQIGDLYYNLDATNQTAEVTSSSDKYSGDIIIPSSVTYNSVSYSVTSIGSSAFYGCTGLTSVTIPGSVTSIGSSAFEGCTGLTSIEIPNSVTRIGNRAFSYCSGLTSLKLSASIEPMNPFIAGFYEYYPTRSSYQGGYEWLKNLISVEAPAWFFDVPESDWIYCPRHLQHVAVNNGELTESVSCPEIR